MNGLEMKDLTIDNITENVIAVNSQCPDPRLRFLLSRLVPHIHDFARETRLSMAEWEAAIEFLVEVGKISTDKRHEFILLSDVLGLSLLVDSIDNPTQPGSTEGTILGPFHTAESEHLEAGSSISRDTDGTPLLVLCSVKDTKGNPLAGVEIDVWETDSKGFYDVQYEDNSRVDGRGVLHSDKDGFFHFQAIVPVPYPIPHDGPVGKLLGKLQRHYYRPSHMHFMFKKPTYKRLITALYVRGSPYESTDAVFGVKESLIVDVEEVDAFPGLAERYKVQAGCKLLRKDFVLMTEEESRLLRDQEAAKASRALEETVEVNNQRSENSS